MYTGKQVPSILLFLCLAVFVLSCTGSTPGIGVSDLVGYQAVCEDESSCIAAQSMHSTIDIHETERVVGVTPCLLGQHFSVPAGEGWQGVYVSPDGDGDGQSPFRPMSLSNVAPAEKIYVSLLPGRYVGLEALVAKASKSIRIVSPCAADHTMVVPGDGVNLTGPDEVVLRGVSFEITGTQGVKASSELRLWVHESSFDGVDGEAVGLSAHASDLIWLSNVRFFGLGIGGLLQARDVRLDDVWFDGQTSGALAVIGDARYRRGRGAAQSLSGVVVDGLKVDFRHEDAFGLTFGFVGASLRNLALSSFDGPLGVGLRFSGSVALVESLDSFAPASPAVFATQSVVWMRESLIDGGSPAIYGSASGNDNPPFNNARVSEFYNTISEDELLPGDVVFSSTQYSALDYPVGLTEFETDAFFKPKSEALNQFELPVSLSDNDFEFAFLGASKVAPQLESNARLADQTVVALGPNLSVVGALGQGVIVDDGAVLVGSGLKVTGTRASGFVQNDRLNGGGHGVLALAPGAVVLQGGEIAGNDGVGVLVRPTPSVRAAEAGQTRMSLSTGLSIAGNHLGGLWVQSLTGTEPPSGTARLSDVIFDGNRLFSMYGSGLDIVLRGGRSEGVKSGAITLKCPTGDTCASPDPQSLTFHDEFHFHRVPVLRLLEVERSDVVPRPVFLQDVSDAMIEPVQSANDVLMQTSEMDDPDARSFIDGTIIYPVESR